MSRLSQIGQRTKLFAVAAVTSLLVTLPVVSMDVASATPPPLFTPGNGTINLRVTSSTASKVTGTPFDGMRVDASGDPITGDIVQGDVIHGYQWIINQDNTGDSRYDPENCFPASAKIPGDPMYGTAGDGYLPINNPGGLVFPAKCDNPSIRSIPATAPVVANGDESDLSTAAALNLPNGKYLISITAPGYKIDGVHFIVNSGVITADNKVLAGHQLEATMNPMPVQTTTVRVNVFNDIAVPDGAWDGLSEPGLSGFAFHMADVLGDEVTTDVYGNALCTEYYRGGGKTPQDFPTTGGAVDYATFDALPIDLDADGLPMPIDSTGGFLPGSRSGCVSNSDGEIQVPNLGPNRYAVTVVAPNADQHIVDTRPNAHNATIERWIKTTTLEGGHDWDSWNQEGGTGYDTERIVANEQTPPVDQGFIAVTNQLPTNPAGTGSVEGQIAIGRVYVPGLTGQANFADAIGSAGTKTDGPVEDGVVALTCIAGCPNIATDEAVYVQRTDLDVNGNGTGHFKINNVPPGQYVVSMWDETQDYILATVQINVVAGKNSNIGTFGLTGWFTHISGTVFIDANGNGKQDYTDVNHNGQHDMGEPGEVGVPRFDIGVKGRDNTTYDQGQTGQATDDNGEYDLAEMYPLTQFLVVEAFNTRYKTTGITYQAGNQPTPTTFLTGQVDIDVLPIIGLNGRLDWGVQTYAPNENGGIVGTVSYDSTRNEHNPAQAGTEAYQPSVAGIQMQLWTPGPNHETYPDGTLGPDGQSIAGALIPFGVACSRSATEYGTVYNGTTGCAPLDSYMTETWARPKGCVARDAQGAVFNDQMALPTFPASPIVDPADPAYGDQPDCVEAPMNGVQFGGDGTVDGNYGFADTPAGDYLVEAVVPTEDDRGVTALNSGRDNKPLYKFTDETSINVFSGDTYVPLNGYSQDDNFNRGALGALWSAPSNFSINASTVLNAQGSGGGGFSGSAIYTSPFGGVNTQVTLTQLPSPGVNPYVGLVLKADAATNPANYLYLRYRNGQVQLVCHGPGNSSSPTGCRSSGTVVGSASVAFLNGQTLGARMVGSGAGRAVQVLRNGTQVASFTLSTTQWNAIRAGLLNGVRVEGLSGSGNVARFDNFHTDSLVPGTPGEATPHIDNSAPPRDKDNVNNPGEIPACAGPLHLVDDSIDPDFTDAVGGSLYNGTLVPECNMKVVRVKNGSSVAPTFSVYTDVPIPARFHGIVINDLNLSADPRSVVFGEAAPAADMPINVYDELGHRKLTVSSDYNGFYELLVPSTDTYNCPLPAGPCPNVYRLVANDPGQPGAPNANYNPTFRTIATNFQAWPGVIHPVDQAPTSITNVIQQPGSQLPTVPQCAVNDATTLANPLITAPEFYNVTDPIVTLATTPFTISGAGFGVTAPTVSLTPVAGGSSVNLPVGSFTQNTISVTVPSSVAGGAYRLKVTAGNGLATVNGVNIHVVRGSYNPRIVRVGPGRTYDPSIDPIDGAGPRAIQRALDFAATGNTTTQNNTVVVVYPNTAPIWAAFNPNASYFENIIVHSNVKLQGVGAGGPGMPGSSIDGSSFWAAGPNDADGSYSAQWLTAAAALLPDLDPIPSGQVVFEVSSSTSNSNTRGVDGFTITGGDQQDFPNTINQIGGSSLGVAPAGTETQGGGVFLLENVRNLTLSDNVISGNGGAYGGAIRVGTPGVNASATQPNGSSTNNTGLRVLNNRIVGNGGSFLAGAVALFNGASNYLIDHNDLCGNYSTEYGGAISHFGLSSGGAITNNRIYFNAAYDEGGGILIAGELPAVSTAQTQGSGTVLIDANLIQDNLANDDGGGLRFLMASGGGTSTNWKMTVTNNIIANNVSTHEGGGVAIDDTPNIDFIGNTVVRNITTATAVTSDGRPAPAGLSTGANSALLQSKLPGGSLAWSKPNIVNDIFADNRAGSWTPSGITGIGKTGDPTPLVMWDMGTIDGAGVLTPTYSIMQSPTTAPAGRPGGTGYVLGAPGVTHNQTVANITAVGFNRLFETSVNAQSMRTNPNFRSAMLLVVDTPVTQMGDYHLASASSPASNAGSAPGASPLNHDIDQQTRGNPVDIGADEILLPTADLGVSKTDGVSAVTRNQALVYTIAVTNHGPAGVTASVNDTFPAQLTAGAWTCSATTGSSCGAASGSGNLATTANLANGGVATYVVNATVSSTAVGTIANTVTVGGSNEPTPNVFPNSATDNDTVTLPPLALPALGLLDNFNRANATSLGASWSQFNAPIVGIGLRVDSNNAFCSTVLIVPAAACVVSPTAFWTAPFLARQGAAFTLANTTINGSSLLLKASGGTPDLPVNYIRVRYSTGSGGQVIVETTTDSGANFTTQATFAGALANGNTLSAVAYDDGTVYVYRTVGVVTTQLGAVFVAGAPWTGAGRIGIRLPIGARVDNFSGGTVA